MEKAGMAFDQRTFRATLIPFSIIGSCEKPFSRMIRLRYKFNAVAMVIARLAFGLFWLWPFFFANAPKAYLVFGAIDLGFGITQGILLFLLLREEERYAQLQGGRSKNKI